ncbi:MAG: SGNH hydrolase domain-containing protein [Paracoccaceae bacterium]
MSDHFQFTTHQINSECGNLYLDEDFSKEIDARKYPRCRLLGWYDNEALTQLIAQADYIWLASAWSMWVAERLPASVENLETKFDKPVFIFGTKNFGEINARFLLDIPVGQRSGATNAISSNSYEIQSYMRGRLREFRFIDISRMICGDDSERCRLFNAAGEPLSFDGGHLTRAGARLLGEALMKSNALSPEVRP